MVTQEILNASAMFRTEEGRRNALRDFIAARVGADNVDRYEPVQSREEMFTSEHTIALLESHDMAEGVAMPVPSDQPHLIHLAVHLQPLQEIAGGIMEAMEKGQPINPQAVLPYFSVAIPHVATTVELAARDPRNRTKIKAVEMQVKQLAGVLKMLEAEAERQAKQEMQQQQEQMQALQQQMQAQPSPELQAKLEMVRGELMIKEMAMQKKAQLNEFKTRHDAALKDFKAQADIMRQNALQAPQAGGTIGG
jgi:flagellar biosynthesis GTPase FlhF